MGAGLQGTLFRPGHRVRIVGDIAGGGGLGTVVRTGVKTPFSKHCIEVERDDGTGSGLYLPSDLRRTNIKGGNR